MQRTVVAILARALAGPDPMNVFYDPLYTHASRRLRSLPDRDAGVAVIGPNWRFRFATTFMFPR
jgi:hypothetical protein